MIAKSILDVHGMRAPEPLERVLEVLPWLQPGDRLRVTHCREPQSFCSALAERGFAHSSKRQENDLFEITIWRRGGSRDC